MILNIEKRDLFTVSKDYILCHCISADFALGAGIAKEFAARGVRDYLLNYYKKYIWESDGYALLSFSTDWRAEFNLVTKEYCFNKPTLTTLQQSLESMKSQLYFDTINKIAMPKIGCGLDRLKWDDVEQIIKEVFTDTDVEILVCDWR